MIQERNCINVFSDMNTWIDFCILVNNTEDFSKTKEIIEKSYNDWWELEDAQFEPLPEYVCKCLTENNIDFDIYFKEEEEEE